MYFHGIPHSRLQFFGRGRTAFREGEISRMTFGNDDDKSASSSLDIILSPSLSLALSLSFSLQFWETFFNRFAQPPIGNHRSINGFDRHAASELFQFLDQLLPIRSNLIRVDL